MTNKTCTSDKVNSTSTGTGEVGCYRWFMFGYDENTQTANLLLDHNTTKLTKYNSNNDNTDSSQIDTILANDVSSWYGTVRSTARLITAEEVAVITGNTTFIANPSTYYLYNNSSTTSSTYSILYCWLDTYTVALSYTKCPSDPVSFANVLNSGGYWTSSTVNGSTTDMWSVDGRMRLIKYAANTTTVYSTYGLGVRPVITVPISVLEN